MSLPQPATTFLSAQEPQLLHFLKTKNQKMETPPHKKTNTFYLFNCGCLEFENAIMEASHADADACSIPRYLFTKRAALSEPSISLRLHEHETRFQQPMP